jgi:hypothetical protein
MLLVVRRGCAGDQEGVGVPAISRGSLCRVVLITHESTVPLSSTARTVGFGGNVGIGSLPARW